MTSLCRFGAGKAEGSAADSDRLGVKGANLCEMASLGLPVPPGFTIPLEEFQEWRRDGVLSYSTQSRLREAIVWLETASGRGFGAEQNPLLVSVRSGAAVSMPGILDTFLNIGLTGAAHKALCREVSPRFGEDCRRRMIPSMAEAALGLDAEDIEEVFADWLVENGHLNEDNLDAVALAGGNTAMMAWIEEEAGALPDDPMEQLVSAVEAVFRSWSSRRARRFRRLQGIDDEAGTAVTIQAMVFGNRGANSATGVAFTRSTTNGAKALTGEYLKNAQGEDVVAGLRTPLPLSREDAYPFGSRVVPMQTAMPEAFDALVQHAMTLEAHFTDVQDIEFTVEDGTLWLLQTRTARRGVRAALRIAVDMAEEGLISRDEALLRVAPDTLEQLLHPRTDPKAVRDPVAKGLPASPGAITGEVVFTAAEAEAMKAKGLPVILVRNETSPEDIHGMYAASGVLTVRGGMTSHAAVVARSLGKPCVCGASNARVDLEQNVLYASDGREIRTGDLLTVDGTSGEALLGEVPMLPPQPEPSYQTLLGWADERRRMKVRANADGANEAATALELGAEGIGLCRTEHGFFRPGRLFALRRLILSETGDDRRAALAELLPQQREDFAAIFRSMKGAPVCVRLLDPPVHEFLPGDEAEIMALAEQLGVNEVIVRGRIEALREYNPMIGRRGCRIGILLPEIYDMQIRALFLAASDLKEEGVEVPLEILLPFVSTERELTILSDRIDGMAASLAHGGGYTPNYQIGAMIETPRAAIIAHKLCARAAFMSFGTNDMTQMVYGLSRDDVGRFVRDYAARGAISHDPFHKLDLDGVAPLLKMAAENGRAQRPELVIGLCGEHAADVTTIQFCESIGLDYVSCPPYRVPASRLACAQATILTERAA